MGTYHQFCPVAKAVELLDERWTLLVVRELLAGSEHFNELRRGVPRMSPTLLSKRLTRLIHAGVVTRHGGGQNVSYRLTRAGQELRPIVEALGTWGIRWISELGDADLDPALFLWDVSRHVESGFIPPGRTVVSFQFDDVEAKWRNWWLVMADGEVDVCDFDPGYEVGIWVHCPLRRIVEVWRGDIGWAQALSSGAVNVRGPAALTRFVPMWFPPTSYATVPRATVPRVTVPA